MHKTNVQILEWLLQCKQFRADVVCYNLLIEAYGKIGQYSEAEKTFYLLRRSFVAPTEMSYNMLMSAYSKGGLLDKAEGLFDVMKGQNYPPGNSSTSSVSQSSWESLKKNLNMRAKNVL